MRMEAGGVYYTDTAGNYRVTGIHMGDAPPGYNPPYYYVNTQTPWSYVGN